MNFKEIVICIRTWVGCLLGYSFYGAGGVFFLTTVFPVSVILKPFGQLSHRFLNFTLHAYLAFLTRVFLPVVQVYDIREISGFRSIPKNRSVIIVANHLGKLDGPLILGLVKGTVATMKSKYASKSLYTMLVKTLDFVSFDTSSLEAMEIAIQRAKKVVEGGKNLMVFPEGRRTASSRLMQFKDFAFRIAQETGRDIVPVVLYSKLAFMGKTPESFFPRRKNSFYLRCLGPVRPHKDEHHADMAARIRKIMTRELEKIIDSS
jgi:1-acyl-sn-glycerol-3-phosphate acyltransferase